MVGLLDSCLILMCLEPLRLEPPKSLLSLLSEKVQKLVGTCLRMLARASTNMTSDAGEAGLAAVDARTSCTSLRGEGRMERLAGGQTHSSQTDAEENPTHSL